MFYNYEINLDTNKHNGWQKEWIWMLLQSFSQKACLEFIQFPPRLTLNFCIHKSHLWAAFTKVDPWNLKFVGCCGSNLLFYSKDLFYVRCCSLIIISLIIIARSFLILFSLNVFKYCYNHNSCIQFWDWLILVG